MKKIVGILAAAAVLATSVFAAELSAGVRLEGELFNYNGTTEGAQALKLTNANQFWHAPLTLSVSSDRAGGTFKFTDGDKDAFTTGKWAIWFKPTDALKVNLGTIDKSMNVETIDWGGRLINYDSFGASLDVNVDALALTLSVVPGRGGYWFKDGNTLKPAAIDEAKKAAVKALPATATDEDKAAAEAAAEAAVATPDAEIGELNVYAAYSADFGTISAMFDAQSSFKDIKVGAGYKGTFDPITLFVDGAFYSKNTDGKTATSFGVDADVVYAQDELNAQAYVKFTANTDAVDKGELLTLAKVSYKLDAGTVYFYFKDGNLMAKDFSATFKPGFTSSVGIMNYEIALQLDVAKKVNVSVPVNFSVNF